MSPFRSLARQMVFRAVLISVAMLSLPSCDSSGPDPEEELLGSWYWSTSVSEYYVTSRVAQPFPLTDRPITGSMTVRGDITWALPYAQISTTRNNKNKNNEGSDWIRFTSYDPGRPQDPVATNIEFFIRIYLGDMGDFQSEAYLYIRYPDASYNRTYSVRVPESRAYNFSNGKIILGPLTLRNNTGSVTVDGIVNFQTLSLLPGQRQRFLSLSDPRPPSPDALGALRRSFMPEGIYQTMHLSSFSGGEHEIINGTWLVNGDSMHINYIDSRFPYPNREDVFYSVREDTLRFIKTSVYCPALECIEVDEYRYGLIPGSLVNLEVDDIKVHKKITE